jgi:hypothetical protein
LKPKGATFELQETELIQTAMFPTGLLLVLMVHYMQLTGSMAGAIRIMAGFGSWMMKKGKTGQQERKPKD